MNLAKCGTHERRLWRKFEGLVRAVAKRHGVRYAELVSETREPRASRARVDAYVCLYGSGLTMSEIARMFGKDTTTIGKGIRKELAS